MRLAAVVPKKNFLLYVVSDDGKKGLFDVSPFLESDAFSPLKEQHEFERIYNGRYFIEWDCGADLSADTIEAQWKELSSTRAEQGAYDNACK